jgi:hypothetical protein
MHRHSILYRNFTAYHPLEIQVPRLRVLPHCKPEAETIISSGRCVSFFITRVLSDMTPRVWVQYKRGWLVDSQEIQAQRNQPPFPTGLPLRRRGAFRPSPHSPHLAAY